MPLLGIDLGTTNTVVSIDRKVHSLADSGRATLPSVVAFLPNGKRNVGEVARRRRAIDCPNTIYSSKRIIGRRFDDGVTKNFIEHYPFDVIETDNGTPAFRTRAGDFSPTQIASFILEDVLARTGIDPSSCETVLTVPASFNEAQRKASADSAAAAGLGYPRLIDEASAAALAYLHSQHQSGTPFRRALVYDLGGGTFDCAVIDCSDGMPAMLSQASDLQLGGDDIDRQLAQWVARLVLEKHNWDLTNYSETYDRLVAHCEAAKIDLSVFEEAPIRLSQVDPECPVDDGSIVLTHDVLDEMCEDLVRHSFVTCDDVLRMAGIAANDIDAVYLAGGTTLLPVVQRSVEAYFGRSGLIDFDPTEVVALGAGLAVGCS
jgi:molecular chaperone DnaK